MTFEPTWESLQRYECPDWFRDAKFGIWAHWGPQCVPMIGDWYARNLYIQGHTQYEHHLKHYGHPSEFGYKDILPLWTAEKFNPEDLIDRYQKAGAKYFVSCAVHCDNFDCWDSKHHPWNSVNIGPKQDIVGRWAKAARDRGLRFGVTEHNERSYSWFNTNKGADKEGPKAGVPYDGNDPANHDYYFPPHDDTNYAYPIDPPKWWQRQWADRIIDVVDQHQPDLLYTDGGIPFGKVGREVVAHFYNQHLTLDGRNDGVFNLKSLAHHAKPNPELIDNTGSTLGGHGDYRDGVGTLDLERGGLDRILDEPWQTDTCVGHWFYSQKQTYKSPQLIIHMLADIVSKNGNLLLNFPQRPDGTLDDACHAILDTLTDWFEVNGEAIYNTRPWHTYGQGKDFPAGDFAEPDQSPLGEGDYRFVTKGDHTLYAIAMGWPAPGNASENAGTFHLTALQSERVAKVELLGHHDPLEWTQDTTGVKIAAPKLPPCALAYCLKLSLD